MQIEIIRMTPAAYSRPSRSTAFRFVLTGALVSAAITTVSANAQTKSKLPTRLQTVVFTHAPLILAENPNGGGNAEAGDQLLAVDFDGDNIAGNNKDHVLQGFVVDGRPRVYFSIVETGGPDYGNFFIGYYFYHPKDGGQSFDACIVWPCTKIVRTGHENDLEGVFLVVEKDPYSPYGRLKYALTQAHGAMIPSYDASFGYNYHALRTPPGGWLGTINHANDPIVGPRAVVMVAQRTHAVYMFEDFYHNTWDTQVSYSANGWGPFGIYSYPNTGSVASVIKAERSLIGYSPALSDADISPRLGPSVHSGRYYYGLTHIADVPFWLLRNSVGQLFQGTSLDLGHGLTGLSDFATSSGQGESANPPWNWPGGAGEGNYGFYWYNYGSDNTGGGYGRHNWPRVPPGAFVTDPRSATYLYFPWAVNTSAYYSFNPYIGAESPPTQQTPQSYTATITGYTNVRPNASCLFSVGTNLPNPTSYIWQVNGVVQAETSPDIRVSSPSSYTLAVTIRNDSGQMAWDDQYVTVSSSAPICYDM